MKLYLILDQSSNLTRAAGLGMELRNIRSDDITFFTSPTLGTGTSADGQSIVVPDWEALEDVRTAFRDGELHVYGVTRETGSELPQ